jgi:lantibiotic modifying enzyme
MNRQQKLEALITRTAGLIKATPFIDDSLAYGKTGVALLYFYSARQFNDENLAGKGLELIEEVIGNIGADTDQSIKTPDFFSGITGLLSVLSNLRQNELLETSRVDFASLDETVFNWTRTQLEENNIDFFYGATGFLHYLSGLEKDETVDGYIDTLTTQLLSRFSEPGNIFGIVNHTYNRMDGREEEEINFSLAHGMVSVLLVLVRLCERGYGNPSVDEAIAKGIDSILSVTQAYAPPLPICFAGSINTGTRQVLYQKRLGWCYSDLNILHLLYRAGKFFNRTDWLDFANERAPIVCARRTKAETLVQDPFLCHGSAGLFQYYQYLSVLTGYQLFEESAEYWLQRALEELDATGDEFFSSPAYLETGHLHSFFYGLTGVALCLLSGLDKENSSWASIIML